MQTCNSDARTRAHTHTHTHTHTHMLDMTVITLWHTDYTNTLHILTNNGLSHNPRAEQFYLGASEHVHWEHKPRAQWEEGEQEDT